MNSEIASQSTNVTSVKQAFDSSEYDFEKYDVQQINKLLKLLKSEKHTYSSKGSALKQLNKMLDQQVTQDALDYIKNTIPMPDTEEAKSEVNQNFMKGLDEETQLIIKDIIQSQLDKNLEQQKQSINKLLLFVKDMNVEDKKKLMQNVISFVKIGVDMYNKKTPQEFDNATRTQDLGDQRPDNELIIEPTKRQKKTLNKVQKQLIEKQNNPMLKLDVKTMLKYTELN